MEGFAYFPSLVYRDEKPEWVDFTLKTVQKYYDQTLQDRPAEQKDWPLLQTAHLANDPDLKFLCDYLLASARMLLQDQGYDVDKYELYLSGLWGQDVMCNGGTNVHVHKNSQISGWLFLETPEGGAYPVFFDPRMNKPMVELDFVQGDNITNATSAVHFKNVIPGTVLFSNSWLQHQLTSNPTNKQTKTVHFIVSHRDKQCSIC